MRWPENIPKGFGKDSIVTSKGMLGRSGKVALSGSRPFGEADYTCKIVAIQRDDDNGRDINYLVFNSAWRKGHDGNGVFMEIGAPVAGFATSHWWIAPQYFEST